MQHEKLVYGGAACLAIIWICSAGETRAARNHNLNINFDGDHCSDLKVRSDGEVAQAAETFTLSRAEAPILEIADTAGHSALRVRGSDRSDFLVEVCRVAAADDRGTADAALRGISVSRTAGRFSTAGPASENVSWQLYFIVHAPRNARLDLETKNGPIDVRDISGNLKLRATNGPISLRECAGQVDAITLNGPISFAGGGGEVQLLARNGPISLELVGDVWNGSQLQARTQNGPVSLSLPDTFRSGVRIETDGNGPLSCGSPMCRNAWTNAASRERTLQMNGSQDTIRITSHNGPVSVSGSKKGRRI
jgi:hypothetical protein